LTFGRPCLYFVDMDGGIKIEFVFTDEQLAKLEERITHAVQAAIDQHLAALNVKKTNLTRKEAATILKTSVRSIDRYIRDGLIRCNRAKRTVLIPESEIDNFLKQSA
jgi:excisionase family DNA binding protein